MLLSLFPTTTFNRFDLPDLQPSNKVLLPTSVLSHPFTSPIFEASSLSITEMSEAASNTGSAPAADPKTTLTPKEEEIFKIAMLKCLKSGAPEIDYGKLQEHGGFNTMKTTQNTWSKIKNKMFKKDEGADGSASPKAPKTPKTPKKATPASRKRTKKESDGDDDGESNESTEKKEGSESPTKKKRATPAKKSKKATEAKSAAEVKSDTSAEEVKREDSDVAKDEDEDGDNIVVKTKSEMKVDE